MALTEHAKRQFEMMQQATAHSHIALLEMRRRLDGTNVAVICAVNREKNGDVSFVPIGEIDMTQNPYMLYQDTSEPIDTMAVCRNCKGWQTITSSIVPERELECPSCKGTGLLDQVLRSEDEAHH